MKSKNLESYIYTFENNFEKDFCNETIKQIEEKLEFNTHKFFDPRTQSYKAESGSKELETAFGDIENNSIIMDKIWHTIKEYIATVNFPWFPGWEGFSAPKFNRYVETRVMKEHCDHIRDLFDGERKGVPILTVLTMLNDDYEGGELVFFEDVIYKQKQGSTIIFPSNFLYPHRVDPVLKGVRYSFANWVW
jgi:hypothetical protein